MAQILIIEDDQRLRLALKESLQLHGYEVTDAANGLEGTNIFRSNRAIRELKRDFPTVKIIAISGGGALGPEHYLNVALALGADIALKKPFRTESLLSHIEELLSI
jgi:DNA-binding response OmpR family regulator